MDEKSEISPEELQELLNELDLAFQRVTEAEDRYYVFKTVVNGL